MMRYTAALVAGILITSVWAGAQSPGPAFKLGTFQQGNRTFAGAVVNESTVVDLAAADPTLPNDVKQIIPQYASVRSKILAAVTAVTQAGTIKSSEITRIGRFDLNALKVMPPVMPRIILNATLNYQEHANELAKNPGAVAGVSVA